MVIYIKGYKLPIRTYEGYSKRESIKRYRDEFNLKYKRIKLYVKYPINGMIPIFPTY